MVKLRTDRTAVRWKSYRQTSRECWIASTKNTSGFMASMRVGNLSSSLHAFKRGGRDPQALRKIRRGGDASTAVKEARLFLDAWNADNDRYMGQEMRLRESSKRLYRADVDELGNLFLRRA